MAELDTQKCLEQIARSHPPPPPFCLSLAFVKYNTSIKLMTLWWILLFFGPGPDGSLKCDPSRQNVLFLSRYMLMARYDGSNGRTYLISPVHSWIRVLWRRPKTRAIRAVAGAEPKQTAHNTRQ